MLMKKSRYKDAKPFEPKHRSGTFPGLRARAIAPLEGVIEHTVVENDRLDHLARQYYNDDRQWWRIVDANPELLDGARLMHPDWVGEVILIPAAKRA